MFRPSIEQLQGTCTVYEKNIFSKQHQDVASSVPTSSQSLTDMFQHTSEHVQYKVLRTDFQIIIKSNEMLQHP